MGVMRQTDLSALDDRIQELVTYAREKDGEDRTALYRNLIDLFLTGKAPYKEPTRGQLLDVIEALLPHVDQDTRRTVADLLLNITQPPMDLIMRIASDDTTIVADLLRGAPFSEEQVIELIETSSRAHHQELATRNDLSANVWIALARAAPTIKDVRIESEALWDKSLGKVVTPFGSATVTKLHPEQIDTAKVRANPNLISTPEDHDLSTPKADDIEKLLMAKLEKAELEIKSNSQIRILSDEESSMGTITKTDPPEGTKLFTADQQDAPTQPIGNDTIAKTSWQWTTGRTSKITATSNCPINNEIIGLDLMTLLGLAEKPNHPVAKAIYRRGSIHDAPIYLSGMERGERYWTLEAKPIFSSGGGTFEGYEGIMIAVDSQTSQELPDTLSKSTYTETEFAPIKADAQIPITNEQEKVDQMTNEDPFDAIRSMVENATREAVEGLSGDLTHAIQKSEDETNTGLKPKPSAIVTQAEKETASNSATTLTMLANTLEKIKDAGERGDQHTLKLHTEIAQACVRSLRDQIGEKQITTIDSIFL